LFLTRHFRKITSARTSHASPSNNVIKNAIPNVVAAIVKNRECWTRFLSLQGESTCLVPTGGGNGLSRVWICRSVASLGGAHALLASRRINYEAADFAVGGGFKCNSNRKLGSEEILLIFRADPEFR